MNLVESDASSGASAGSTLDTETLAAALARCCDALDAATDELNTLDAQLGDGDLGVTLARCAAHLRTVLAQPLADAPGPLLKAAGQACAKASGSSFGTLLAVGLLAAGRAAGDRTALDHAACVSILDTVGKALSARGGAKLGDKTMLDSLQAIKVAVEYANAGDRESWAQAAVAASQGALETFRPLANRIGRARMFGDRSIGLDDPGMVAMQRLVQAL